MINKRAEAYSSYLPLLIVTAATLVCLLPFIGKAFNIDEPLFIWVAKHLHTDALDFYGFNINWYGTEASAAEIIKNPPLASYYLAVAGYLAGWSETSLHLAFLLPALAAAIGTYFLARELSQHPLPATLLALFTPVFVISSTTVMCDTMMLALYVWAVFLWVRGMKGDGCGDLLLASLLVALCSLTKYFGMSLIPLLLLYTLCSRQGRKRNALFLLFPIIVLCGYQLGTEALYGRGLLLDAASYANAAKAYGFKDLFSSLITGLSFFGGCFIPTLLFAPALWGRRVVVIALAAVPLFAFGLSLLSFPVRPASVSWAYYLHLALYVFAGVQLFAIAVRDLWEKRDAASLLLFLWATGTFVFAAFLNWSVNGRSILPMIPVAGLLVVRGLARKGCDLNEMALLRTRSFLAPLICACLISIMLAWSDYTLAGTARSAARQIAQNYQRGGQPLLFQGHWGFQYYMEQNGALAWDARKMYAKPLVMAVPENNTNIDSEIMAQGTPLQFIQLAPARFLTTMSPEMRAGFYSSVRGALPFAFGAVPDERYAVLLFR